MPSNSSSYAITQLTLWKVLFRNQKLNTVLLWILKKFRYCLNVLVPIKAADSPHWIFN